MNQEIFDQFPFAIIRVTIGNQISLANRQGKDLLQRLNSDFIQKILQDTSNVSITKSWILPSEEVLFVQFYTVSGSRDKLLLIGTEMEFMNHLPPSFEQILEDFSTDLYVVNLRIASLVQKATTFERFDLIRVDRTLRKYNYEYSIGLDIEGVLRTAYSSIAEIALEWIIQNGESILVSKLSPDNFKFREDPQLYQTGFCSILRVPIVFDHGVIGAILLASSQAEQFQIEDALFFDILAKLVSQFFFHAGNQMLNEFHRLGTATLLQSVISSISNQNALEFLSDYCTQLHLNAKVDRVSIYRFDEDLKNYCSIAESGKLIEDLGKWTPNTDIGLQEMLNRKSIVAFNLADRRFSNLQEDLIGRGITAILYAPIENHEQQIIAALIGVTYDESALSLATTGVFKIASDQLGLILSKLPLNDLFKNCPKKCNIPTVPRGFEHIIGSSNVMRETIHQASIAAKYDFPILITGETGTGKELFAKAIHQYGPSSQGPFIVVNSAAIPPNLLESELFGYKEGAFTGGIRGGKKGKFQLADGGTLFLDEICELPLELQAKLLRVIQEQEVEPLGASKPIEINVRIISATNRDLKGMVQQGDFREDLLYRLNAIEILLPPLRERSHDILELAESLLNFLSRTHGTVTKTLSPEAKMQLLNYSWPGNVRQLQNIINRLFVFVEGQVINSKDLPPDLYVQSSQGSDSEYQRLERLLNEFAGNKTAMAHYLGITRTGLWKKLKRLGLQ